MGHIIPQVTATLGTTFELKLTKEMQSKATKYCYSFQIASETIFQVQELAQKQF